MEIPMTPLTLLPTRCVARTGHPAPRGAYGRLYRAVIEGRLPAEKHGRNWLVPDEALPIAERELGMQPIAAA